MCHASLKQGRKACRHAHEILILVFPENLAAISFGGKKYDRMPENIFRFRTTKSPQCNSLAAAATQWNPSGNIFSNEPRRGQGRPSKRRGSIDSILPTIAFGCHGQLLGMVIPGETVCSILQQLVTPVFSMSRRIEPTQASQRICSDRLGAGLQNMDSCSKPGRALYEKI